MSERYPGFAFGGSTAGSWDRQFGSLENQIQQQYQRGRWWGGGGGGGGVGAAAAAAAARCWGSMSEGGGVSGAGAGDSSRTNLIVNYLPQSVTEKDLFDMFSSIGQIESCRVMKDYKTGYSYGFGFVNFAREDEAARAINTFNGFSLRNKRLKVSYARPSGEEIKDTNLYVTNLPRAVTEQQLETIFGKYGRIVQKHILRDKNNGTPRGIAFVRYDKREEAQEAISALNNVIPEGGTEPLSVKVAEEHGKQKAAYYAGWSAGLHHNRGDFPGPGWGPPDESLCGAGDFPGPGWGPPGPGGPMPPDAMPMRLGFPPMSPPPPLARRMGPALRPPYPNFLTGKVGPRAARGRHAPWSTDFAPGPERFKGQRFRNVPSAYW